MKTFSKILMIVAILVMLDSCSDIADLGSSKTKTPILSPILNDDSLTFLEFTPIDFGDVRINQTYYRYVVVNNLSDALTIVIDNIKLKNNFGFELYPENGFPVTILPKQSNINNQLIAKWDTSKDTIGFYRDTIIFNGSQQFRWFIKGNVVN